MRAPLPLRAGWWLLALPLVSGCDLALMGLVGPGVLPGTGWPLSGTVLDARTRLPIGGATVQSGLGTTVTDAQGHFNLYGRLSSREISVSRAGYTAITLGGIARGQEPEEYVLDPLYADTQALPSRHLQLQGIVTDASGAPLPDGLVLFGGQSARVSNGGYSLTYGGEAPGKLVTSVFAAGRTSAPYQQEGVAPQPFHFLSFAYQLSNWPLADTIPQGQQTKHFTVPGTIGFHQVQVRYSNLSGVSSVQTDVALDFGVAGFVPVAREMGSNQEITVPDVPGLKYYLQGEAKYAGGSNVSTVSIVTNDPGQAPFQLLSPPKVISPVNGATGAGARPTFSWTPVASPGVVMYEVRLMEGAVAADGSVTYESKPKWVARTPDAYVTYPGFSASDVNAAALRADRRYLWHLTATDSLAAQELPTRRDALAPFRVRQRAAETLGYTFSL